MSWTGAVVLFSMFFFLVLFLVLPRGVSTQAEDGEIVPGTPPGAPTHINIMRKFLWAAIGALILLGIMTLIFEFELITTDDLSFLIPEPLLREPTAL